LKLLLDTHTLLWFVLGDVRCSTRARTEIESEANSIFISPASHWEIAIKIGLGKYALPGSFRAFFEAAIASNGFTVLPIEPHHTAQLIDLPVHHRDPFDRLIVAQAMAEGMSVVSADEVIDRYGVTRIW
jgi:PIN domain nuclease of toxin-antitoxin system